MKFTDPYRPEWDEIKQWAYLTDAVEPVQDWDILVKWEIYPQLIVELAADESCPGRGYFLHILYVLTGRIIYSNDKSIHLDRLFMFASEKKQPELNLWIEKSKRLLKNPEEFVYSDWF